MLNKAQKLMNQRNEMIREAKEVLATLQITEEEMMYTSTVSSIVINKGRIIEVPVTKEIVKEVTKEVIVKETDEELQIAYDNLAKDFANRCERIEDLKDELEVKQGIIDHQALTIKCLNEQIAELEAKINAPKSTFKAVDDPMYNNTEEVESMENIQDTKDWYSFMSIPEELKDNEYVCNMYKSCGDMYNNPVETRIRQRVIRTKEQCMEKQIADFKEVVAKALEEQKKLDKYNLSLNRIENKKTNAYTSVYGKITLAGKEYAYKYDATFEYPVVYGCMDMDLIKEATSVLIPKAQFTIGDECYNQHKHAVHYDFDNNIVVWVSDDGVFKGYTDKYAFVWDPSQAVPCGIPNLRAMESFRRYKKMNEACWSKGPAAIGQSIMEYCREMMEETKAVNKVTKEIATQTTNDEDELPDELDNLEW